MPAMTLTRLINTNVIVHKVQARADNRSSLSMQLTGLVFEMPAPNTNGANNKNNKNRENGDGDGNPADPVAVGEEPSKAFANSTTKTTSSESTHKRARTQTPAAGNTATGSQRQGRSITLTSRSASWGASRDAN
eukprot:jgi/Psemu1/10001/gm1.10001_g